MKANGQSKDRFSDQNRGKNNGNQGVLFGSAVRAGHTKKYSATDEAIGIIIAMFGGTVMENTVPREGTPRDNGRDTAHRASSERMINAQGGAAESLARFSSTPLYKLCEL